MKQFADRIENVLKNYEASGLENVLYTQLTDISHAIAGHVNDTDMTYIEHSDMQLITDLCERHAQFKDNQDHEIIEAAQKIQKIILNRVGSRAWQQYNKDHQ